MPEVDVFPNPSRQKPPASKKFKAVVAPRGTVKSAHSLGIGYGSTRVVARRRAMSDYKRKHKRGRLLR